ncbi:MAG: hypothetical protein JOZ18_18045, partial [Chloroflexi bacterium]|nr:hypothetical protein [Chloroflexota bacterium]
MSTYSFASKLRGGKSLYTALPLLSGVLIALQLVLPALAFATSSASGFTFGQSQVLDRASVSLVRLVVSYGSNSPAPPGTCPSSSVVGLGALVGSWTTKTGSATFK